MIDAACAKYNLHMRSADYIRDANEELKKHFQPSPAAMFGNFIPNTLASEDPTPRVQAPPVAVAANSTKRSRFTSDFSVPSCRRKLNKKTPSSPLAPSQPAEGGSGASGSGGRA